MSTKWLCNSIVSSTFPSAFSPTGKTKNCTCTYTSVWRCFDLTMYLYHIMDSLQFHILFPFSSDVIFHPINY